MKAIIMAGGEGTRLRPVSDGIPKPMVPLLGRPVLEHIINLLRSHGITEICLTLKYMPAEITEYFGDGSALGIALTYRVESTPLGTAGGIRSCMDFIGNEDFLVISGDAACDFDLSALIGEHMKKLCAVTMALHEHPEPLAYGTVLTDAGARVLRFIEKPEWPQVITDLVNTGIYVISPQVMSRIPESTPFDFAKELFPRLMEEGEIIRGVRLDGYWCDIGAPAAYHRCVMDALDGKIALVPPLSATQIPTGVKIIPPVFIGPRVRFGASAFIGPNVSIEGHSFIGSGAKIEHSVLLNTFIENGVELTGVTCCPGSVVPRETRPAAGSVIARREYSPPSPPLPAPIRTPNPRTIDSTDCSRSVASPNRAKTMRLLSESFLPLGADFGDGLSIKTKKGTVRIAPAPDRDAIIIEARAQSPSLSGDLASEYENVVRNAAL